ncbi:MAG: hypothetical protein M3548_24045 [Actinomycetota bacterium]|nr:hypothetical protein [Actinomycetota bacterium]
MSSGNNIHVGGDFDGNAVAGDNNVVNSTVGSDQRTELVALLKELRRLLEANAAAIPAYDLVAHDVDALTGESGKPAAEAKPALARSLWGRVRGALTGLTATSGDLAAIGTHVSEINTAIGNVFGP